MKKKNCRNQSNYYYDGCFHGSKYLPCSTCTCCYKESSGCRRNLHKKQHTLQKSEEDVDDNWNEYDVEVTLSVEDGKLKDISVSPKKRI